MSIIDTVRDKSYDVTDEEFEELMRLSAASDQVQTTIKGDYFQILKKRMLKLYEQEPVVDMADALERAHERLYEIVVDTYVAAFDDPLERNKASNFARSAKSVIKKGLENGVDPYSEMVSKSKTQERVKMLTTKTKSPLDQAEEVLSRTSNKLNELEEQELLNFDDIQSLVGNYLGEYIK